MKPVPETHPDYRSSLKHRLQRHRISWRVQTPPVRDIYSRFRDLDLSSVDRIMQDKYSDLSAPPRQPSCMLKSLLLMLETKTVSIPLWVQSFHTSPLYAILSGFDPKDLPGVGTFYDFIDRLWDLDTPNSSPYVKPPRKKKVKKPKTKGHKAVPIKKESVGDLIERLSATAFSLDEEAYGTLLAIYKTCFLDESIRRGDICTNTLSIAGDGTPVVTAARFRSHHTCDCWKKGIFDCNCDRFYPQPDCDVGWDSSREQWYFGYDLYLLTDADSGLPVFPYLSPASTHDSHGFCENFFRFRSFLPDMKPKTLLLDSAHDSMAMYQYCKKESIIPYIDLNLGNTKKTTDYHGVTISPDGTPVCSAGLKMKSNGNDNVRQYAKYRCPLNNNGICTCENPCSDAKYGRTCSIPLKNNIRLYTSPPRSSDEWHMMYNKRTASERCNKQIKQDALLELGRHRSSKLWYARLYLIIMLQPLSHWKVEA